MNEYQQCVARFKKAKTMIEANLPAKVAAEVIGAIDAMLVMESKKPTQFALDMSAEPVLGNQHHEAVDPELDQPRLLAQFDVILGYMSDRQWHDQYAMSEKLGIPQGSIGSQIRNARVAGYIISKRRVENTGTWEYRLEGKKEKTNAVSQNIA